jgi:hypothetical protein
MLYNLRAHIVQLSPAKAVARDMPRKFYVTPGDVLLPHHVYSFVSGLQVSEVCASTHPTSLDHRTPKL